MTTTIAASSGIHAYVIIAMLLSGRALGIARSRFNDQYFATTAPPPPNLKSSPSSTVE